MLESIFIGWLILMAVSLALGFISALFSSNLAPHPSAFQRRLAEKRAEWARKDRL